jgi:hypothetical protein
MADLTNYNIYKNKDFQILTDEGFKDFEGIIEGQNPIKLRMTFSNGSILLCTPKHKIILKDLNYKYAKDLSVGDIVYNGIIITDIEKQENDELVYDILHVHDNHRFIVNGILSHQCLICDELAFVDDGMAREFWSAILPTVSNNPNAKVLVASTPNGVGNLYHEVWETAQNPKSGWGHIKVPWYEIPGKTKEWAAQERITLGDDKFEQEYECKFLEGGDSCISEELYLQLQKRCIKPHITLYDGAYNVFVEPNVKDRIYVAGVDIGEGVGACYSTISIFDITEMTEIEQVATYSSNDVGPYEFARILNEIMGHWGKPPLAVERNNTGGGVVITRLDKDFNYPNLINFATKQGNIDRSHLKGVTSSTNTKYHGVMNLFYWLKTQKRVILRDIETLKELNTFVRHKNEKWAKKSDSHFDDRVDAMIWALIAVHEMVVSQFFTVEMWDDNKKPLLLKPLYSSTMDSSQRYAFGNENNNYGIDQILLPMGGDNDPFIQEMNDMGWLTPEQNNQSGWSSYEPAEKYFG